MAETLAQLERLTFETPDAFEAATASVDPSKPISAFITGGLELQLGLRIGGNYRYLSGTRAELEAIYAAVYNLQANVSTLFGLISGAQVGPVFRGIMAVPPAIAGSDKGYIPWYARTQPNPLTGISLRVENADAGLGFDIYLACKEADTQGIYNVELVGEAFLAVRAGASDEYFLKLYDSQDNALANTDTGYIGYAVIPNNTPGVFVLRKVSGGSPTSETLGWVVAPDGINMPILNSAPFNCFLKSRDFNLKVGELVPGFTVEVPFEFLLRGNTPATPEPDIMFRARLGPTNLFPTDSLVEVRCTTDEGLRTFTGVFRLTVLSRSGSPGSESIKVLSTFEFGDLPSSAYRYNPTSEIVTLSSTTLGAAARQLHLSVEGTSAIQWMSFLRSSMTVQTPMVIL